VRIVIGIGLLLVAVVDSAAQRRAPPVVGPPGSPVIPGGPGKPISPPRPSLPGAGYGGDGRSFWRHPSATGAVGSAPYIVPVPVYVGGSYDEGVPLPGEEPTGVAAPMPTQPSVIVITPPSTPPPAAIEQRVQNTSPAVPSEKGCAPSLPEDPVRFFVALKDGSVQIAVAYWVVDGILHYLTPEGSHNLVSLELVDRKLSARLNDTGRVQFVLPPQR